MNGKLKAILVISLAFNLSVLAALAYGWIRNTQIDRPSPRHPAELDRIDYRCRRLANRISLPAEKAEHLECIMMGEEEEHRLVRGRLHEARRELFDMVWAEDPDEQAVMEKVAEVALLQGELEKLFTQRLLKARSILDPEEEKRFHDHMMRRMDRLFGSEKRPHHFPHRDGGRR